LGLLLLRFGAGIALICLGITDFTGPPVERVTADRDLVAAAGGILLLAGMWTPVAGAFLAIEQLWVAAAVYASSHDCQWIHVLLAVLAAAVAMLGPGAWSVDAHRFGRKRFDTDRYWGG
jgi:putative oxidoreductase